MARHINSDCSVTFTKYFSTELSYISIHLSIFGTCMYLKGPIPQWCQSSTGVLCEKCRLLDAYLMGAQSRLWLIELVHKFNVILEEYRTGYFELQMFELECVFRQCDSAHRCSTSQHTSLGPSYDSRVSITLKTSEFWIAVAFDTLVWLVF